MHVLDELSYTSDHIWTNLLTQCTSVPVPIFCCFSISGFPTIKSAPKILEKSDKKSAHRNLPESPGWGQKATTREPGALVARPRGWPRQGVPGSLVDPLAAPLRLYLPPEEDIPNIEVLFPMSSLYRRRRRFKIGAAKRSCPSTLPEGGTTSGSPSSPWTPPGCVVSSPPWTMGP